VGAEHAHGNGRCLFCFFLCLFACNNHRVTSSFLILLPGVLTDASAI
jgi:hypothetical protein